MFYVSSTYSSTEQKIESNELRSATGSNKLLMGYRGFNPSRPAQVIKHLETTYNNMLPGVDIIVMLPFDYSSLSSQKNRIINFLKLNEPGNQEKKVILLKNIQKSGSKNTKASLQAFSQQSTVRHETRNSKGRLIKSITEKRCIIFSPSISSIKAIPKRSRAEHVSFVFNHEFAHCANMIINSTRRHSLHERESWANSFAALMHRKQTSGGRELIARVAHGYRKNPSLQEIGYLPGPIEKIIKLNYRREIKNKSPAQLFNLAYKIGSSN